MSTIDRAVDVARRHWARTNPTGSASWEGMSSHRQDLLTHRMAGVVEALREEGLLVTPEHDLEQRRAGAVEALRSAADEFGAESGLFERWSRGTIAASLRDIAHLVEAGER